MALDSNIELLLATMDLKLVQLLRDAIRTADIHGAIERGGIDGSPFGPAATIEPRRHLTPEPVYEPRRHIHPEPRYEARPIIHPTPRVVEPPPVVLPIPEAEQARVHKFPFVPPWKVLPWEYPPQPALKVKLIKSKPDIVRRGSLVDCFI